MDIVDFHEKFKLDYNGPPRELPDDLQRFRNQFMDEELTEYEFAVSLPNREKMLDGLVDLVYVAIGTAYLHGFDFDEAWRRVHEANMKKIAKPSIRSDYDVVKPAGWTSPDLSDLV